MEQSTFDYLRDFCQTMRDRNREKYLDCIHGELDFEAQFHSGMEQAFEIVLSELQRLERYEKE